MFTAGPAAMTTIRFQTGWRKYARSATSGAMTSSGFIVGCKPLHVAAERDRPDGVRSRRLRPPLRDERREEQGEALDAHADRLGGHEAPTGGG